MMMFFQYLKQHRFLYPATTVILITVSLYACPLYAKDYFNPKALSNIDDADLADLNSLEQFSYSGAQLPGRYNVNVLLNDKTLGLRDIDFIFDKETNQLEPVLTKQMLLDWGVRVDVLPALKDLPSDTKITNLGHYIEYATSDFIFTKQILKISIPQIALDRNVRDQIDPALFNQGVPALILNYDATGARTWYKNQNHQDSRFLGLRSGVNLGAWRFRNYSTYDYNDGKGNWDSINTFLERDIQPLNSQLTIGETTTDAIIFDGFQFKGVKLASDESMLPYSLRGFAPVVRGFAETNAKVIVRQNGSVIYQTYVAPGPFMLTDLYPTAYSGNLEVTVEEDDGRKNSFTVPFSSLAIMQREGGIKYSATVGKYRSNTNETRNPDFTEGTLIYGLPWNTTIFGGTLLSDNYKSYASGFGFNLGDFGAVSVDTRYASAIFDFDRTKKTGQAYRGQYSKTVQDTSSTISLEANRYSSRGFYDFREANEIRAFELDSSKRSRYKVNLSQSLSNYGSFYISGYQQDYWRSPRKEHNINAGYNIVLKRISYGLSYDYTKANSRFDTSKTHQVSFRVSIPLDDWLPGRNYLTSNISSSGSGKTTSQVGLSGNALDNNLTYSLRQSHEQQTHSSSSNATLGYLGSSGSANLGYAHTDLNNRLDYGLQGGVIVHPQGITLSQTLGETVAIVAAPGASDVPVQNTQGVSTNRWGYAVKPYITPYAENNISLNVENLSKDVDIVNNRVTVIPTKGAVVFANINTQVGYRILMTITNNDKPLPFGSTVSLLKGESDGIVGDNGEVYLSGMPNEGQLVAKWGSASDQSCKINYALPANADDSPVKLITASCT